MDQHPASPTQIEARLLSSDEEFPNNARLTLLVSLDDKFGN